MDFLYQTLKDQLNPKHPLYQLANTIDWESVDLTLWNITLIFGGRTNLSG